MTLNETSLEKKFENVTNSQESIQSLSLWILHHKIHHKRIVEIWMKCLEKAKTSHRLALFYLANDVIQHAKRKAITQYLDDFAEVLKDAVALVKDDKLKSSIERVFSIWAERNVYGEDFIEELRAILSGVNPRAAMASKIVAEFKLSDLIEKIRKMKKVELYTKAKLDSLINCKVDATSSEVLNQLKDKTHGEQFTRDFDDATKCLESTIHALEKDVALRTELVENLEKSEIFYDTQKDEAKIVANAYKNFGLRVKNVQKKLLESKSTLPSPLPSPCADAPSPTNSDDGPHLPGMENSLSAMKFLSQITAYDESHKNQSKSSLDQRLALLQSMPQMGEQNKLLGNKFEASQNRNSQQISNTPLVNNYWPPESNFRSTTSYPVPYQETQSYSHNQFYGNYSQLSDSISFHERQNVQPIQVISSRNEQNGNLNNLQMGLIGNQLPSENFEPADMDLGNSDEDDNVIHRVNSQMRTIKVIETRRGSNEVHSNEVKANNGGNLDYSRNISYPQMKSGGYIPGPSTSDSLNSFRVPRNSVSNLITPRYSSTNFNTNSSHQHIHNNRNWRPRNLRKGGFRRY